MKFFKMVMLPTVLFINQISSWVITSAIPRDPDHQHGQDEVEIKCEKSWSGFRNKKWIIYSDYGSSKED